MEVMTTGPAKEKFIACIDLPGYIAPEKEENTDDSDKTVVVIKCETWDDFIKNVRRVEGKPLGRRLYRGHRNTEFRLSSLFERWLWGSSGEI